MPYIIYLSNPYNYTNYASYNVGDIMEIDEKKLNLIEIVLRAYDPWYSCAAHMIVKNEKGEVLFEVIKEE